MEFGLAARFESEIIFLAVADDFLHDGSHLIDLNGEDDEMLGLEVVGFLRLGKAGCRLLNAVVEDVGKRSSIGAVMSRSASSVTT